MKLLFKAINEGKVPFLFRLDSFETVSDLAQDVLTIYESLPQAVSQNTAQAITEGLTRRTDVEQETTDDE